MIVCFLKISCKAFSFLNIYIKYDAGRSETTYLLLNNHRDRVVSTKRVKLREEKFPWKEFQYCAAYIFMTELWDQTWGEKTKSHHFPLRIGQRSIYKDN